MRYIDLLNSAVSNAQRGLTAQQAGTVDDALAIADTLFPTVSQAVCEAAAASEYRRSLIMRQKAITLVAGTATLSSDVLTHYIPDSVLIDPALTTKRYAYRQYPDFIRRGDRRLGIYTLQGGDTLQVIEPNVGFTVPLVATGTRTLTVPTVVVKPASATTAIDCVDEILSDLDEALANALRGSIIKEAGQAA